GLGGEFAHLVVFVGDTFYVVKSRIFGAVEAGNEHLRKANIFGPGDAAWLIFAEFAEAKVRADARDAVVGKVFFEFCAAIFGKTCEAGVSVADGRAKLDGLKAGVGERFDGAGEVFGDHLADRPGLAADGKAEGIRAGSEGK